jgi:hypothetical protein
MIEDWGLRIADCGLRIAEMLATKDKDHQTLKE